MAILVAFALSGLKILREYERAVVFRLGRVVGAAGCTAVTVGGGCRT
jgi:regulator of protease activity HflC (stomatin/prohibitin superfamily)